MKTYRRGGNCMLFASSMATALVIASHNFELLRQQCTRAVVLANGSVAFDGHVESAIDWYQRLMQAP